MLNFRGVNEKSDIVLDDGFQFPNLRSTVWSPGQATPRSTYFTPTFPPNFILILVLLQKKRCYNTSKNTNKQKMNKT